jgi:PAS domain-containing protein
MNQPAQDPKGVVAFWAPEFFVSTPVGVGKGLMVVLTNAGERIISKYHNMFRTEGVSVPIVRGVAHDVTDQKRKERALRLPEEKLSKAFLASPYAGPLPLFRILANAEGNRQPYKEHVHQQALNESCEPERAPEVKC